MAYYWVKALSPRDWEPAERDEAGRWWIIGDEEPWTTVAVVGAPIEHALLCDVCHQPAAETFVQCLGCRTEADRKTQERIDHDKSR